MEGRPYFRSTQNGELLTRSSSEAVCARVAEQRHPVATLPRPGIKQYMLCGLGLLVGCIVYEVGLWPFVASFHYPKTPVREIRTFGEGTATSHFVPEPFGTYGNRLTGNPILPEASTGVILGDSHVVQDSVSDADTVGSVVERLARAAGYKWNVKQYGWYGADTPTFIAVAPEIIARLNPAWVTVLLNGTDFGADAIVTGRYFRMRIAPDESFRLIDLREPEATGPAEQLRQLGARSSLLLTLRRRITDMLANSVHAKRKPMAASDPLREEIARVPRASMRGLKQAYGERLLIVYTPHCNPDCSAEPDSHEQKLLNACKDIGVRCISVRKEMNEDLVATGRLSRGFHNTAPSAGHLNAAGLEIVGKSMWRELQVPVAK
jgi:hypothetical protein